MKWAQSLGYRPAGAGAKAVCRTVLSDSEFQTLCGHYGHYEHYGRYGHTDIMDVTDVTDITDVTNIT